MNYFAHGLSFLEDPHFLAGTAIPDWLTVADRRTRIPYDLAHEATAHRDEEIAAMAEGICQHHKDDAWFHQSEVFVQTCGLWTDRLRKILHQGKHRPSFLAHILVEVLFDAALIEESPHAIDAYYSRLESLDRGFLRRAVQELSRNDQVDVAPFVDRFCQARFLYDYLDDERLLYRVGQVMARVRLDRPGQVLGPFLNDARHELRQVRNDLFPPR